MGNKKIVRSKTAILLISIFFGQFGLDRFLMGQWGWGLLKLVTFGGFGIWWLVDIILIATNYEFKNVKLE